MKLKIQLILVLIITLIASGVFIFYACGFATCEYNYAQELITALGYQLLLFVFLYVYLYLNIFNRIDIFTNEIKRISCLSTPTKLFPIGNNKDEIGNLITVANDLIKTSSNYYTQEVRQAQLYQNLVYDMPAMVCRFDRDYILTFVNNTYQDFFQLSYDELVGEKWLKLIPLYEQDMVKQKLALLTEEEPVISYSHKIMRKDGTKVWTAWTDRAIFDNGILIEYQSIGWDISEQKAAEAELKNSLKFEEFSKQLIFDLVDISERRVSKKVETVLTQMLYYLDVDRTYIFEFNDQSHTVFSNTYEIVKPGITGEKATLQNLLVEDYEDLFNSFKSLEPIVIPCVSKMSDKSSRETLERQGIQSCILIPISNNSKPLGFLGIDIVKKQREWKDYEINLLSIIARIVGIVLYPTPLDDH